METTAYIPTKFCTLIWGTPDQCVHVALPPWTLTKAELHIGNQN